MQHRCYIEAGQLVHILHFVEFGRIHLLEVIFCKLVVVYRSPLSQLHFIGTFVFNSRCQKAVRFVRNTHLSFLSPFCLCVRIIKHISVKRKSFYLRIRPVNFRVTIRHVEECRDLLSSTVCRSHLTDCKYAEQTESLSQPLLRC